MSCPVLLRVLTFSVRAHALYLGSMRAFQARMQFSRTLPELRARPMSPQPLTHTYSYACTLHARTLHARIRAVRPRPALWYSAAACKTWTAPTTMR